MKNRQKTIKILTLVIVVLIGIIALITKVYSDNNNHFVVDVVKTSAMNEDDNLKITESIVKAPGQQYYDAENLNYEVEISNKNGEKSASQVALVVDTSYSMKNNDTMDVAKAQAKALAQGIFDNVKSIQMSLISNNGMKVGQTTNSTSIVNAIDSLTSGESANCNDGLVAAYNSFGTPAAGQTLNKVIIYFTDSTDSVSDKMKEIMTKDPSLKIISVLVDLTSSSYLNLSTGDAVAGEVYVLPNGVSASDIVPNNVAIYDAQNIYDELNYAANNIKVVNTFSSTISDCFTITNITSPVGTVNTALDKDNKIIGYAWSIDQLNFQETAKLTFTIKFRKDANVDAGAIFNDTYTNKKQQIIYNKYNTSILTTMEGTDEREGTESTVIKICQGYDLNIKAVSESNSDLPVEGVEITVIGENEAGEKVCNFTKTTNAQGYITITAEEAQSLRGDGVITYTLTANNAGSLLGYETTSAMVFAIDNNKVSRKLIFDDMGCNITNIINETTRNVEVHMPIACTKIDFEIRASELNNSTVTLSDCEFELIQPKLNNKYEMSVLSGKTDANGVLHLNPTVMTKDGTYNYILRQVSAPASYDVTGLTLISITFKNGRIVASNKTTNEIKTMYNEDVKAFLDTASGNATTDHVIVTVQDISLQGSSFDLKIDVSDVEDNSKKLDGVKYLVTTTNSLGQTRKEYVTTDSNGQINTKVLGTGFLTIQIQETKAKVGYTEDKDVKEILVQRLNDKITIISANPADKYNTDIYKTKYLKDTEGNPIGLEVDLASHKKQQQNVIKLQLVEKDDPTINIGAGILYNLYDSTGKNYGPAVSDQDGIVEILLGNQPQGTHQFELRVDASTIPNEYSKTDIDSLITIEAEFDADGYLTGNTHVISASRTVIREGYVAENIDKYLNYTHVITIGYQLDATYEFTILLRDKKDLTTPLDEAKYNIVIEYNSIQNGTTVKRVKKLTNRQTNIAGKITTKLVASDEVIINVQEVEPKIGYAPETAKQQIILRKDNSGAMVIDSQGPFDLGATNTTEPNKGASISGKVVTYYDYNRGRSAEDNYLNLTIIKQDPALSYVNGVYVNVKSDDLVDGDNKPLDLTIKTGSQATPAKIMDGEVTFDYEEFIKAEPNSYTIRVPGIKFSAANATIPEETVKTMEITEMELVGGKLVEKNGTKVKLRLIYRTLGNTIKLTNVETIYGNRLVIQKEFSTSSDTSEGGKLADTLGIYLSNITINLLTNYDDIGNVGIDLKKKGIVDATDAENVIYNELVGAEYDVKVVNPDGTVVKRHIFIDNGTTSSSIELDGLILNKGSVIYFTETKAPTGYELNTYDEIFEVTDINEAGEVSLKQQASSYSPARFELKQLVSTVNSAGNTKTNYQLEFIDYQVNTFNITINAVDNVTKNVVKEYEFDVKTSTGAQGIANSGIQTKIGGNPAGTTVTYTIEQKKAEKYYKLSKDKVNVNVVFDATGNVDVAATLAGQTDVNYGKTWTIKNLNPTSTGELVVDIEVLHYDPLKVKVHTVDSITDVEINTAEYSIQPSINLPATGKYDFSQNCVPISVGYMIENGSITYTLEQTSISKAYEQIANQQFTANYANGEIISVTTTAQPSTMVVTNFVGTGEIELTVYVVPKVPFDIVNKEYFAPNAPLVGANFEVTEVTSAKTDTGTTNTSGQTTIYTGTIDKSKTKLFLVKETKAAVGYATVEDFYVKVEFDANGKITSAILADQYGNPVSSDDNRFVTVSYTDNAGNPVDNVNIEVKNYPEFKINTKDVDRRDGATPIQGTTYDITSYYLDSTNTKQNFMSSTGAVTDSTGLAVSRLDRTKMETVVTYVIKEADSAIGYQTLGQEVEVLVTFDADGFVSNVQLKDQSQANIAKAEMISGDVGRFEINVELKNNPLLKININSLDNVNHTIPVKSAGYKIIGVESVNTVSVSSDINKANITGTPKVSYSDANGLSISYMDTTLANKEIVYTIKQDQKAVGYEWLGTEILLKVAYDANGAIASVKVEQNLVETILYGELQSFDSANFTINVATYHEEIKQFGISLIAEDTYDNTKKINDLTVEAWLAEPSSNGTAPDANYALTGADALTTGKVWSDADGVTSYNAGGTIGETYKPIAEYQPGSTEEGYRETRLLRLVVKNDSQSTRDSGYYLDSADGSNSGKELGYYQGTTYVDNSRYETVKYAYAILVTFDEEGKIVDTAVRSRLDSYIGWQVDEGYLEVDHTNYTIKVKMNFFPMLKLTSQAVDNFMNFSELGLTGAKFTVSTYRHDRYSYEDEYVTAGYIGYGEQYAKDAIAYGHRYEDADTLYVPIEKEYTRQYYIFEDVEPTNYQQHRDRKGPGPYYYEQQLVAIISIVFDKKGEIDYDHSISRYIKDTSGNWTGTYTPIYMAEDGVTYLPSDENVKNYNYDYTKYASKSTTEVKIGYALTTSIQVTAVDDISGNPITNIRMYPYVNNTYKTNTSYLYTKLNYKTTDNTGTTDWKYWGAAVPGTTDTYIIGSGRSGSNYNGYLFPDDMASKDLGGSGDAEDYYAKLDVDYDSNGRITQVKSLGSDLWGDDNVKPDITWDSDTGKIYIKMIYSRKFQVKLNKIDFYDKTISLSADFNAVSNKGLSTKMSSDDAMNCLGKVYQNATVKYSLSETRIPDGY